MPNRVEQTTICVNQGTKNKLRAYWNEKDHTSWDIFMEDVVELLDEHIGSES
jgi:hypothetical protein